MVNQMQKHLSFFMRLSLTVLLTVILCWGIAWTPAEAGEWDLLLGFNWGDSSTLNGDLTLRRSFDPLYAGDVIEISPFVEGSGVYWHNDEDSIVGAGAAVGLTVSFWRTGAVSPFIAGSFGGFLLSDDTISSRDLGCLFQFRSKGSIGLRFGNLFRHSIQFDVAHFSNAGLSSHNAGFNTYGVAYGFRF